ncbi:MAG: hypothetical protein M3P51_14705 [Chloroflexota bacterium]|nr:hypothetical protein [Chloroflexota bacterium]
MVLRRESERQGKLYNDVGLILQNYAREILAFHKDELANALTVSGVEPDTIQMVLEAHDEAIEPALVRSSTKPT